MLTWKLSSTARLGIENQISSVVSPANDPWFQLETWCAEFSMCSVVKLLAPHCQKYHLKSDKWEHKEMHACVNYTEAPWDITWKVWKHLPLLICRLIQFHLPVLEPSLIWTLMAVVWPQLMVGLKCTLSPGMPVSPPHRQVHVCLWTFWDVLNH